jgi:hypothetical protein
VSYPCDHYDNLNSIDIQPFLDQLNARSIRFNWLTVCHDFSGRNIAKLAYYYDRKLSGHLNHIIYGLAAREDGSCYVDLCDPKSKFVSREDYDGGPITVFNPYSSNTMCEMAGNFLPDEQVIIKHQIELYFKTTVQHVTDDVLTCFRQVGLLLSGENPTISVWNSAYIRDAYQIPVNHMIANGEIDTLHRMIQSVVQGELTGFFEPYYGMSTDCFINKLMVRVCGERDVYKRDAIIRAEINRVIESQRI